MGDRSGAKVNIRSIDGKMGNDFFGIPLKGVRLDRTAEFPLKRLNMGIPGPIFTRTLASCASGAPTPPSQIIAKQSAPGAFGHWNWTFLERSTDLARLAMRSGLACRGWSRPTTIKPDAAEYGRSHHGAPVQDLRQLWHPNLQPSPADP